MNSPGGADPAFARSWLFVPGDRPDRFAKAAASGAEVVICDLEDAVSPGAKDAARREVANWLAGGGSAWVRINGETTPWHSAGLDALAGAPGLQGVVVPKAESPSTFAGIGKVLGEERRLVALVETALGMIGAHDIARCESVCRLGFGSIDFADIEADGASGALLLARSTLVLASRAASKPSPIDGVTTSMSDQALVEHDARQARSLGFGGKLCIHPSQIAPVAAAFARRTTKSGGSGRVLDAVSKSDRGAHRLDNAMIDKPVIEHAKRILGTAPPGSRHLDR